MKVKISDAEKRKKKRIWAKKNPEKVAASRKKWREKNKEKNDAYNLLWKQENHERFLELVRQYKQRVKEKKLKKYFRDLAYERKNPGRGLRYYYANRERILAQKKEQRMRKAA